MSAKSLQNEESSRVDHYTNPTLVQPWGWLLPTPMVLEGLRADYGLTPISSCSQEAFDPSDNANNLVDDNLANWLQRESLRGLATDTIEEAILVVFDTTIPLCNGDWSEEAIGRTPYPGPDSCTFQGELPSDGMKDPRETAIPAYQILSRQEDPASLSTGAGKASDSCGFASQLGSSPEYSRASGKSSNQSSQKSPCPTTLADSESASGVTRDSPFKRKIDHCRVERRYRTRLNTSFQNLLQALPQKVVGQSQVNSLNRPRKGNVGKGEVLELARVHIKALEERLTWLEEDRKALIGGLEDLKRP